ncbi:aminodeoxychorismate lyase [Serratia liquefaciens]|uniref:aminodeoxychorismate lyase n=1 Tax=Serratia liquefaciens TaxID=614 RepID=UPI001021E6FC|nr:aminodeoxychorismate lyase [Serratia liquefaciens]MDU3934949.1 aminodeoxychorismate lyase [Serratia liquefaciens]RYM73106.1 aminodeoxychorismate lyase [Serratia liquefaciens]
MYWINGQQHDALAPSDRGLQFGDGCFTTARVVEGKIDLLPWHIERLQQSAQRLMLPACDWDALEYEMVRAAESIPQGVVKAILTRGSGGRGYSPKGCEHPTRIVSRSAYPMHYLQWREQGISLALSPVTLARHPLLAGLKHLNRLDQVLIRAHLDQTAADEALVLDTAGMLVECCAANLFWRKGKAVFTPDLSQAGVAGLMRRRVIELLAGSRYSLHYVSEPLETLADAEEVLVSNALMPLLPVNIAQSWHYSSRQLYDFLRPHC